MWGSPLLVGNKVYLCDEDGDVAIFNASKEEPKDPPTHNLGAAIYGTPVFANGVLYIMAKDKVYAIQEGAQSKPATAEAGSNGAADANK